MKLATIITMAPIAFASPIVKNDGSFVLNNLDVQSLVSETNVEFNDGRISIYSIDDNNNSTVPTDGSTDGLEKLAFPATNGQLTVVDGTGRLVGTVAPNSKGFGISLDLEWLANPIKGDVPAVGSGTRAIFADDEFFRIPSVRFKPSVGRPNTFRKPTPVQKPQNPKPQSPKPPAQKPNPQPAAPKSPPAKSATSNLDKYIKAVKKTGDTAEKISDLVKTVVEAKNDLVGPSESSDTPSLSSDAPSLSSDVPTLNSDVPVTPVTNTIASSAPAVKRDDSAKLFLPVFVQGTGVTFASALGLDEVIFNGDAIVLAGSGDLFMDVDNVIDYQNCALCNLPTSS